MPTALHDLVCVHIENKPAFFARIEDIAPDRKPGWWQVKLLVLTHPIQVFTWILDESQINGSPFTMGGTPVFLEKVVSPVHCEEGNSRPEREGEFNGGGKKAGKIVSLFDRKKDK